MTAAKTRLRLAHLLLALPLAACSPGSDDAAGSTASSAAAGASSSVPAEPATPATPAAAVTGANALRFTIDGAEHQVQTDSGSALREAAMGAEGIDAVTIEVYNSDNTLYAKADLFVASAEAAEGEYALGALGDEGVRNHPRRGQVSLAVDDAGGVRQMVVSKDGQLSLRREGEALVAEFSFSRSFFGGDTPIAAAGEIRVGKAAAVR
jgi:hypothetical protein